MSTYNIAVIVGSLRKDSFNRKLATALAVLRLAAGGALALDDPLARHLPHARAAVPGVILRRRPFHHGYAVGLSDAPVGGPLSKEGFVRLRFPLRSNTCRSTLVL